MERTFTTATAGVTALHLPTGTAQVRVDPTAKTATVRLHTPDQDGPAAEAIRNAQSSTGHGLKVIVPDNGAGSGNITVVSRGRYSNVSVSGGGGTVIVNGNVISSDGLSQGIAADVTVPPGAELAFQGRSADLDVTGPLAALDATTVSGDIQAGVVGTARVRTTSGDIEINAVSQQIDANTVSGDIEIGSYSGGHALLSSVSGDVELAATQNAAGAMSARTVSGDIRLRGTEHLRPQVSSVSGRVRT